MIIPLLGMTFFSVTTATTKRGVAVEAQDLDLLINLSVKTGNLLHETQKERGATAVYMASGGEKFVTELPAQQATTDTPRAEFLDFVRLHRDKLPQKVVDGLAPALTALGQLDTERAGAVSLTAETRATIGYFTDMNAKFLAAIAAVATASTNAELRGDATAYLSFLDAKELTGVERAQLSAVFGVDEFAPGQFATVVSLIAGQKAFLMSFEHIAQDEVIAFYGQTQTDPIVAETTRLESIAIDNGVAGFGVDSAVWFETITARINLLKEVEDFQADRILLRSTEIADQASTDFVRSIVLAFGLLGATVLLGTATIIGLARQLRRIAEGATKIANGHLRVDPIEVRSNDDLGKLGQAFNEMSTNLASLIDQLGASSTRLGTSASELTAVSTSMVDSAGRTVDQASSASDTTSMVSSNMESVVGAVEQMKAAIQEISENAAQAARIGAEAVEIAGENSATISNLRRSSGEIGDVIGMISTIAQQTNLLALNATIEAARAGASGRGFAVVAHEVKQLAGQTAEATSQISTQVEAIQVEIAHAVDANTQISLTIDSIAEISSTIAAAVEEQSATTAAMATNIDQVTTGSRDIAETAVTVAAAANQTQASSTQSRSAIDEMTNVAHELDDLVSHYN